MQQPEIQKIKQLIEASSLLSPGEKQEWLALMNIMNEKQLRELRNILETAAASAPSLAFKPGLPVGHAFQIGKADEKGAKAAMGIPTLTHIMNMPKAGTAVFPHQEVRSKKQEVRVEEKKSKFWQKIKDVLAEKELPPGHAEPVLELELPAPGQTSAIKTTGINRAKTLTSGLKAPVPQKKPAEEVPAAPGQAPNVYIGTLNVDNLTLSGNEPMQIGLSLAKPQAAGAQSPRAQPAEKVLEGAKPQDFLSGLKNKIAGHAAAAGPTDDYSIYSAISAGKVKSEAAGKPAENFFVAGLKETGILMDAKFKPTGNTGGGPRQSMEIASLQSVSKLGEGDVSKDIVPPLKKLAAAYGYHNLVLALEKSPLFKAYINAGLSALSGKTGLDESKPGFLRRQDFERFVDVLREIKN